MHVDIVVPAKIVTVRFTVPQSIVQYAPNFIRYSLLCYIYINLILSLI